ncbi:hypothetical protein TgHK011_004787 [Trichoderma gracile]|nr:hypothetical protein TgHK011_004787 [Trichoderma gracile]
MVAFLRLLTVLGLLLADGAHVAAQGSHGIPKRKEDWTEGESSFITSAYIVGFEDGSEEPSLFSDLPQYGLAATKRLSYNYTLFKGASFQLDAVDLDLHSTSAKNATVPSTSSDLNYLRDVADLLRRTASAKDTYAVHAQVKVDQIHAEGITGKGIRISIADTGVDIGGCFGKGCIVSYARDMVGDNYDGNNTPVPGPEPFGTCDGHGTHVTGIIGALPNPTGFIAATPDATVGMCRVFGCSGDVGADVPSQQRSLFVAVSRIVSAGVVCTVANGNSGSAGLFLAGTPANGKGVTAVCSVDSRPLTPYLGTGAFVSTSISTADQTLFVNTPGAFAFPNNITLQGWPVTPNVTPDGSYGAYNPLSDKAPADLIDEAVLVK